MMIVLKLSGGGIFFGRVFYTIRYAYRLPNSSKEELAQIK